MMATENIVQPAIPRFDGLYDLEHANGELLKVQGVWQVVESGVAEPAARVTLLETQKRELEALKLKDLKAKNYLFQAIDRAILETILSKIYLQADLGLHEEELSREPEGKAGAASRTSDRI